LLLTHAAAPIAQGFAGQLPEYGRDGSLGGVAKRWGLEREVRGHDGADMSNCDAVRGLINSTIDKCGRLDITRASNARSI
jgi:hypothetical protein